MEIKGNKCRNCGAIREYPQNNWIDTCPRCNSTDIEHYTARLSGQAQMDAHVVEAVLGDGCKHKPCQYSGTTMSVGCDGAQCPDGTCMEAARAALEGE